MTTQPLVVVGPTACGKSTAALAVARRFPGTEVISADAMAVYRTMDIGTAKPSEDDRSLVPHHGVDVVEPHQEFAVTDFQQLASDALTSVEEAGNPVVIVGGTGLYVRAVVDNFNVPPQYPDVRAQLEAEADTGSLWNRLRLLDPEAADKMLPGNRRRVIRALEVSVGSGRPFSSFGPGVDSYPPSRFRLAGLEIDRDEMDRRIDARYDRQMAEGMLSEVAAVAEAGMSKTAAQALGYKELLQHLDGDLSLDDALEEAKRRTRRFARRQQRWFRRDPRITWFPALDPQLVDRIATWWQQDSSEGDSGVDQAAS